MIIAVVARCRVASDKYQWIAQSAAAQSWRDMAYFGRLADALDELVALKLCNEREVSGGRAIAARIEATRRQLYQTISGKTVRAPAAGNNALEISTDWKLGLNSRGRRPTYQLCRRFARQGDRFEVESEFQCVAQALFYWFHRQVRMAGNVGRIGEFEKLAVLAASRAIGEGVGEPV